MFEILIAVLVLGVLILIHELGHFMAARLTGVRVTQFSIGLPPKAFGKQIGETEYVISMIPFGGYVRLDGQTPGEENPEDPRNYASKNGWQKFIILAGGSLMNLLLAFVVMPIVFMVGVETPAWQNLAPVVESVEIGSQADVVGFKPGDRITRVGNTETGTWDDVFDTMSDVALGSATVVATVERDGLGVILSIPKRSLTGKESFGWKPRQENIIGGLVAGLPGKESGLMAGDRVISVNGKPTPTWDTIADMIQREGRNPMSFELLREGQAVTLTVTAKLIPEVNKYQVGIQPNSTIESYPVGESIVRGSIAMVDITGRTFVFLGKLLSGQASLNEVSGPVGIFSTIGDAAESGAPHLLFLVALITLQLGIINLLPIPPLDGGHILLLGVESIIRRPIEMDLRMKMQVAGSVMLYLILIIVTIREIGQKFF
ncbi:MAG: RIP metalloprotease RseP [Deltaproteobacteria bacterium]|nr:RIP metalloprotease RseP [Deltaproteobacteria bacterium]